MTQQLMSANGQDIVTLAKAVDRLIQSKADPDAVLPDRSVLDSARKALVHDLSSTGLGLEQTIQHLHDNVAPALNNASRSANFYGFVTGGASPAARYADYMVTTYDNSPQVHMPNDTIATDVEDAALQMLADLLHLGDTPNGSTRFPHRTFTTGATASNIIGLACGREHVLNQAIIRSGGGSETNGTVGDRGIFAAMRAAGVDDLQILTTVPHSSLRKAASILGFGRQAVIDVSRKDAPTRFDFDLLATHLAAPNSVSIVAVSCAEVNTGLYATYGEDMQTIRKLCDQHHAWIHVDGAFGILARVFLDQSSQHITSNDFQASMKSVVDGTRHIELADSIAGDGHKLLNVPYDCGFVYTRSVSNAINVFQNPGAVYLGGLVNDPDVIPSPLHIGIENSRRFRALPVYAALTAYGRDGFRDMLQRQVTLARKVATYIRDHDAFELLPKGLQNPIDNVFIIVIFRAIDTSLNRQLVSKINVTRKIFVSGTTWDGGPASRFAIANWQVDVERDFAKICGVLDLVTRDAQN